MAGQGQIDEAGRAALSRVLEAIRAEEADAHGFLEGFLGGLDEYLAGMLNGGARAPAVSPPR